MATMKPPAVPVQPPDVLTEAERRALVVACRDRAAAGGN